MGRTRCALFFVIHIVVCSTCFEQMVGDVIVLFYSVVLLYVCLVFLCLALLLSSASCASLLGLTRIVQLDLDLKYRTNIRDLFQEFDKFPPGAVIGITREMQPVYR